MISLSTKVMKNYSYWHCQLLSSVWTQSDSSRTCTHFVREFINLGQSLKVQKQSWAMTIAIVHRTLSQNVHWSRCQGRRSAWSPNRSPVVPCKSSNRGREDGGVQHMPAACGMAACCRDQYLCQHSSTPSLRTLPDGDATVCCSWNHSLYTALGRPEEYKLKSIEFCLSIDLNPVPVDCFTENL